MKPYLALIRNDIRLAFRQRVVIFFSYLMPLLFFFIFAQGFHAEQGGAIVQVVTMVAVIGIIGNGLMGAGMRSVQDREANILRRFKVAPISPLPLLVASTVTGLIVYLPFIAIMIFVANTRYGMALPAHLGEAFVFITLGVVALRAIGLILASVVNSMSEAQVLVQILYMAMLFLSGATFPLAILPDWLFTITQFIPSTYLVTGLQGIMLRNETLANNWQAVAALAVTTAIGLTTAVRLFRWEKEEKIRPAAKAWVVAVLLPFFVLGTYQAKAKENAVKTKIFDRDMSRSRTRLIRNARIIIGDGRVIENGGLLVKNGKIAAVYDGAIPEPKSVNAEAMEAAGKTILPGLIDTHVHLGSSGGIAQNQQEQPADAVKTMERELAAYLYSGVTAVRSAGDALDPMLEVRSHVNSGEKLGAELFIAGPVFTTEAGYGTERLRGLPDPLRREVESEIVRLPKSADEAKRDVDELSARNVDAITAILDSGAGAARYKRLDVGILDAIGAEARADGLPLMVQTGDAKDVEDALKAGASSIEQGSFREKIPDSDFAAMAAAGVTYDPTLSVGEALPEFAAGRTDLLERSLVEQVAPPNLLASTRSLIASPGERAIRQSMNGYPVHMDIALDNLRRALKAGVTLVTGTDAGNMLVMHGPTVQHEIALWVAAGIPVQGALRAATLNAAKALHADARMGTIEAGKDATMVAVDGNPLQDVKTLESISFVIFKGEDVNRQGLLKGEDRTRK